MNKACGGSSSSLLLLIFVLDEVVCVFFDQGVQSFSERVY